MGVRRTRFLLIQYKCWGDCAAVFLHALPEGGGTPPPQHNTPEAGAGIVQFLLRLHSKTSMVISFLSNLGRFNSALRLHVPGHDCMY